VLQRPGPAQNDYLIHFCGRGAHIHTDNVPAPILKLDPRERLEQILRDRTILAFQQHNGGWPAVCFSETDAGYEHLQFLLAERGFTAWGLVFTREWVTQQGGGPVFSARSEVHNSVDYLANLEFQQTGQRAINADRIRTFMTRYEPFATRPSDWLWEQEWRLPVPGGELTLPTGSLAAILVADPVWWPRYPDDEPLPIWIEAPKVYWDGRRLLQVKAQGEV
jgi:hypothetical protein